MSDHLNAADALYAAAAEIDEPPLWQALADATNGLIEYGIDPFPGQLVIDDDFVHGSCKRVAGKRLAWRIPESQAVATWVVEDRDDNPDTQKEA